MIKSTSQDPTDDRVVLLNIDDNETYSGLRRLAIHHSGSEKPLDLSFIITQILNNYFKTRD